MGRESEHLQQPWEDLEEEEKLHDDHVATQEQHETRSTTINRM